MTILAVVIAAVFGATIGSFLNVVIWRLPREQSLNGRSHCPHCNHQLNWYDLTPVMSYAIQGGKCRYCSAKISARYPIIEIATALLFAGAMRQFMPSSFNNWADWLYLVQAVIVIAVCVSVFVIDLEHFLILDKIVYPAIGLMIILAFSISAATGDFSTIIYSLLASTLAFIPFWLIWYVSRGRWMGFGDVKFVAFMGLALGIPGIFIGLFLAFTIGAAVGVGLILFRGKELGSKVPFGVFLSLATIITLFYGSQLWIGYWSMLGMA